MLGGMRKPTDDRNHLCQSIKQNCCTGEDQLTILKEADTKLLPALAAYQDKMMKAIRDLEKINLDAQKIRFSAYLDKDKRNFCETKEKEFKKIDIKEILKKLNVGFNRAFMDFKDQHYSFFCVLCDYEAHGKITTTGKKITLDSSNCISHIQNNKDFVVTLNIDLIDYLKKLIQFVDCAYYDKEIEFPFLWDNQAKFEIISKNCLDQIDPDSSELSAACKEFCEVYDIAGISPHLEGDPLFIDMAIDFLSGLISEINHRSKNSAASFNPMNHLEDLNNKNDEEVELFNAGKGGAERKLKRELLFDRRLLEDVVAETNETTPEAGSEGENTEGTEGNPAATSEATEKKSCLSEKEYMEIYDSIEFSFNVNSTEMAKNSEDPINLSSFIKEFKTGSGIRLDIYFEGNNFDLSADELQKLLKQEKSQAEGGHIDVLLSICTAEAKDNILKDLSENYSFVLSDNLVEPFEKDAIATPEGTYEAEEILDKAEADAQKAKESTAEAAEIVTEGGGDKAAEGETADATKEEVRKLRQGHRRRKRYQTRAKRYRKRNRNKRYIRRNRRRRKHRKHRYRNLEELTGIRVPFNNLNI
jgi:hypothetical protein